MDCKSTITELDAVTRQFAVSIPAELFGKEAESAVSNYVKRSTLKGFRPGKAPRDLIEKMHGEQIRIEVAHDLVSNSLRDLIQEHKIDIVGRPEINIEPVVVGKEIQYTAKISVFPNPTIQGFEKIKVRVAQRTVKADQVEQIINEAREQRATPQKLAFRNTAQMGDVLDGTLVITIDGETPTRPEPFALVLGQGRLPKEVEEALVGLEVGQSKTVRGSLPDGLKDASKTAKEADYNIQLISLSERVLPEVNDEFVKSLNFGVATVAELNEKLKKHVEEAAERDRKKDVQAAALDALCAQNDFLIPQALIDEEIRELLVRYNIIDPNKQDPSQVPVEQYRAVLGETASRRVKGAVIVDQIAKAEKVEVKEEDITAALQTIADENKVSIDDVRKFFMAQQRMLGLMTELRRTKVLESLVERSVVEYFDPATEKKDEADVKEASPSADAEAPKKKKAKSAKA